MSRHKQHRADRVARRDDELLARINNATERTAETMNGQPIASTLAALERDERAQLFSQYRDLLQQATHTPEQVELLRTLMRRLGKSPDDVHRDVATLQRATAAVEHITDGASVADELQRLQAALGPAAEQLQATINRLQAEHQQRVAAVSALSDRQFRGMESKNALRELIRQSPELLAHVSDSLA